MGDLAPVLPSPFRPSPQSSFLPWDGRLPRQFILYEAIFCEDSRTRTERALTAIDN